MQDKKPNVLVIISDHLSTRAVGAYDESSWADTPHIDRIAKRGVTFDNMYTSCPLCAPARASFWTGRFPHDTGVLANGKKVGHAGVLPNRDVPDDMPTLGESFKEAGYQTIHFGKCHDSGGWVDEHSSLGGPVSHPKEAIELPELPENFNVADWESLPLLVRYMCCSHIRTGQTAHYTEEDWRYYIDAFRHYSKMADDHVGTILQLLEDGGVLDDTLVVLMADHGDGMGSHQTATKQVAFYEETMRVPFIVAGPGVKKGGQRITTLTSLLYLFPGLCECAGIAAPEDLPGTSFAPLLKEERLEREFVAAEWYSEWGYTVSPGRMIRSKDFKYISYLEGSGGADDPSGGEQLYDLRQDRCEQVTWPQMQHTTKCYSHTGPCSNSMSTSKKIRFIRKKSSSIKSGVRMHRVINHHSGAPAPMADKG